MKKVFIFYTPAMEHGPFLEMVRKILKEKNISLQEYGNLYGEPSVKEIDEIAAEARKKDFDGIIAMGGGSVLDTGKAVSMLLKNEGFLKEYLFGGERIVKNKGIPVICVPTTAGTGSEVTGAAVFLDEETQNKLSVSSELLIPDYAIIDPVLHISLPQKLTASTGIDTLTHAIESYVSLKANPVIDVLALKAIQMVNDNLRLAYSDGTNMEARGQMALAAALGGICISNSTVGVAHGIAQAMGGLAHIPHGVANGVILPYVMETNFIGNIGKFADIADMMGEQMKGSSKREKALQSVQAVRNLVHDVGIPGCLREVGITEEQLPHIVKLTQEYRLLPVNPRKLTKEDIEHIVKRAYEGFR